MRLTRVRFTVRRLMAAVAVVGVIAGLLVEGERRRVRFRDLAAWHEAEVMRYFVLIPGGESEYQRRAFQRYEEVFGPTIIYHGSLRLKYERAARLPWLPVTPDPPPPPAPIESVQELLGRVRP
jgi:hypothetical protein